MSQAFIFYYVLISSILKIVFVGMALYYFFKEWGKNGSKAQTRQKKETLQGSIQRFQEMVDE